MRLIPIFLVPTNLLLLFLLQPEFIHGKVPPSPKTPPRPTSSCMERLRSSRPGTASIQRWKETQFQNCKNSCIIKDGFYLSDDQQNYYEASKPQLYLGLKCFCTMPDQLRKRIANSYGTQAADSYARSIIWGNVQKSRNKLQDTANNKRIQPIIWFTTIQLIQSPLVYPFGRQRGPECDKFRVPNPLPVQQFEGQSGYVHSIGPWGVESLSSFAKDYVGWLKIKGGEWPSGHPLPIPEWGTPREPYKLPSVEAYQDIALAFESKIQQLLQSNNYNTVSNLITFYQTYRRSSETNLSQFFRCYIPPISSKHHTCVGLALELIDRLRELENRFPGLNDRVYIVSSQVEIPDTVRYLSSDFDPWKVDKAHLLIAMRVDIDGRKGILLLDPGYQVARAITVMEDKKYPHTGWFTLKKHGNYEDYNYVIYEPNPSYVLWSIRENTGTAAENLEQRAIYVAAPFNSPVDVSERRNLCDNFQLLLSTDAKGHLISGIYFPIKKEGPGDFYIFYQNKDGAEKKMTIPFAAFESPDSLLNADQMHAVNMCNKQLGLADGKLTSKLKMLNKILNDKGFIYQMLYIHQRFYLPGKGI